MNNIKNFLFNKVNLVYFSITIMMLSTVTMLSPFTTELNIVILLWGGIYFIYDIITKRSCINSKYKVYLIIYMIIFFISIILNIENNLIDNLKTFVYTGFFLFVLYSYDTKKELHNTQKELVNFNNIVIFISSITSFIAIIMFILLIQFTYNDIPQGFIYPDSPALWGLYSNPNSGGMIATLSIILTIVNIYLYKILNTKTISKTKFSYYIFNIVTQWLYLVLCNSRGAVLSLLATILFGVFYKYFYKFKEKFNIIKSIIISLLISFIVFFGYNIFLSISKSTLAYIPKYVEELTSTNNVNTPNSDIEINLDREIKSGHISTGRAEIWSYGLNTLKFNPLFGHGPGNIGLAKQKLYPNDTSKYVITNNMHNGYIQILLSNGILGVIFFGIFMILIAKDSLIAILNHNININKNHKETIVLILAPILAIAVNGMFENVILLTQSYITTILWTCMGYLSLCLSNLHLKKNVKC